VVWPHSSVGPAVDFVREEAAVATLRGVLMPVMMDSVAAPLGFGEIQAIDLSRWSGSVDDRFFRDLHEAIILKLSGQPVPKAIGPASRVLWRIRYASIATAIVFALVAFGANLFDIQDRMCTIPLLQPSLSDMCGAAGLGHRPGANERVAWESGTRETATLCATTSIGLRTAGIKTLRRACSRRSESRRWRRGSRPKSV